MKKLLLPILCALMLCGCADTPPEETTASTETTTPAETTAVETTTAETTAAETTTEPTTEAPIATETTYIESLGEAKVKLSTMSEEDLRGLLAEANIEIPDPIKTVNLRMLFAMLEEDPEKESFLYYLIFSAYSQKLRHSAKEYLPLTEEYPELYPKFSEMTDEEIDVFLAKNEIVLPPELGPFDVRAALISYESDPNKNIFGASFPVEEFFDQCRSLMKSHYGIYDPTQDPLCMGKPPLSLMSEEECRRILLEGGADIPDFYEIDYIKKVIRLCEENPDYVFGFGSPILADRYESIRNAVRAYYGIGPFDFEEWYNSFQETTEPFL